MVDSKGMGAEGEGEAMEMGIGMGMGMEGVGAGGDIRNGNTDEKESRWTMYASPVGQKGENMEGAGYVST